MLISNNSFILQIDRHTFGRLDGHTDIRTYPNCIIIKIFVKSFFSTAISGYPVIFRISGQISVRPNPSFRDLIIKMFLPLFRSGRDCHSCPHPPDPAQIKINCKCADENVRQKTQ